jgi:hypothetical protein
MLTSNRPIGRIAWPLFAAIGAGQLVILWSTYALSGSNDLQALVMVVLALTWRPFRYRAAKKRPFPPFPDPPPRATNPKGIALLIGGLAISIGVMWLLYRGLGALSVYPGAWVFFMLGFGLPLAFLGNKFGRQPKGVHPPTEAAAGPRSA